MVRQLLNQLKVLVDECKRTFQPWVMKRETVIGKKKLPSNFDKRETVIGKKKLPSNLKIPHKGLRNLFVPSKLFSKINYELYVEHGECSVIISFCSFNSLGNFQL